MNPLFNMQSFIVTSILLIYGLSMAESAHPPKKAPVSKSWCEQALRPALSKLQAVKTNSPWFRVYLVGENVYAIDEPYNYQEVISYLILGKQKAILFDTGMGMDSISPLINQLTQLPVTVLNSHTHYDHMGGNYEFKAIMAMNTEYTRNSARRGWSHEQVKQEVSPQSFCSQRLPHLDTANYYIRPFHIHQFIDDGYRIELGDRILKVMAAPGHTPDAIALYDSAKGYLWTGDSFYEGPIFLFGAETDLSAYAKSIDKMARLATHLKRVFPSHNIPIASPSELREASLAFKQIRAGLVQGKPQENGTLLFEFQAFSFLIEKSLLHPK